MRGGSGGREFVALGEEEESILSKKGNKKNERVVVVLCHPLFPFPFISVLSVEEDERRKKVGKEESLNC